MAAIYDNPPLSRWQSLGLLFVSLVIVLIPLSWGIYLSYYAYTNFGPAAVSAWCAPWIFTAVILLLICLLLGWHIWRRTHFAILVYSNGLRMGVHNGNYRSKTHKNPSILKKITKPHDRIVPWESIKGISIDRVAAGNGKSPAHTVTLYLASNKQVTISEARTGSAGLYGMIGPPRVQNLPELATRIKACLYPRLLPELRKAFINGQHLPFGPLTIQKSSIYLPGHPPTRWSQVRRMTVKEGKLVVELESSDKTHSTARLPVSKVPNLELLFQVVDDLATPG